MKIFKSQVHDPDFEWEFIVSSVVKAHQYSGWCTWTVNWFYNHGWRSTWL